jgi:molybdate transport system permease protein
MRATLIVASAVLLAFIVLPLGGLFVRQTPAELLAALATPAARTALGLSVATTIVSLGVTVVLGTPLAYVLARGDFRGRRVLDALVDLPIVVPPAVAGLALLLVFGRFGMLGPSLALLGIQLSFTTAAVVMAQVFVGSSYYVRAARTGFFGVDRTLEAASATLGMGPVRTFALVTVPLAAPALIGGAVLSWARALGEFGATIMFAGNLAGVSQTLPLAVYLNLESGNIAVATAISVLMILLSLGTILVVRSFDPG